MSADRAEPEPRSWWRDHGLLMANLGLFVVFFIAMVVSGVHTYNADQADHAQATVSLA